MVVDAVRTYLDAASGLTELSRKEAVAAAKALLRANGAAAPEQPRDEALPPRVGQNIQALAGELIETSQANRAAIATLVRTEVERQLERMDVVPRGEYDRLVRRVAELERRLAARGQARATAVDAAAVPEPDPARGVPAADPVGEAAGDAGSAGSADAIVDDAPATADGRVREHPDSGAAETGPDATAPDSAPEASGGDAEPADGDGPSAARAKGRSTAKDASKPSTAKSTRARSTGKRTTKGRGTAKK
ncbi:membrane fusogenic activity family protein [Nocardiopsis sp. NPDC050513]|uniref:membrane fusogenic activity family protein n=1 Tax=Nocardiopsis sp. NPDC050513 TaxID=3364338 RepID=UPI0037A84A23